MDTRDSYVLTSDPEVSVIAGYGHEAALIFAVQEFSSGVRVLLNTLKTVAEQTLVGNNQEDEETIQEALNFSGRGFSYLAHAAGIYGKGHPLRSPAEAAWDRLFPVDEDYDNYTFADVTIADVLHVDARIRSGEIADAVRLIFDMTDPNIAPEYALEALRGD